MYHKRKIRRKKTSAYAWLFAAIVGVSLLTAGRVLAAPEDPDVEEAARAAREKAAQEEREKAVQEQAAQQEREKAIQEAAQQEREKAIQETAQQKQESEPEKEPVIVIDPGHGGLDDGCVRDSIREKDINLQIALLVSDKLSEMGYAVRLSRQEDVYLSKEERVEQANVQETLIFVSIHQNSCEDATAAGVETWYDGSDRFRDSKRLARLVNQETAKSTGAVERELVGASDLCVTTKTDMPSCLIETGFLTNPQERGLLVTGEYQGDRSLLSSKDYVSDL